jgi:prostaglandin-E synthase 1
MGEHRNEENPMNALASLPAFQPYVISLLVLGANLVGLANATALTRGQASEVINPEDVALNKKASVVYEGGNDRTARYRRAHRNALENTPVFMISALVLTLMGASATVAAALFYSYAALRIAHSVCYVKGIQPFRTLSFVLALLVQIAVLGLIGYGAFAG